MRAIVLISLLLCCAAQNRPRKLKLDDDVVIKLAQECTRDDDLECFTKCLDMRIGVMSRSGVPNLRKIKELFNMNSFEISVFKQCIENHDMEDLCKKAHMMEMCINKSFQTGSGK